MKVRTNDYNQGNKLGLVIQVYLNPSRIGFLALGLLPNTLIRHFATARTD